MTRDSGQAGQDLARGRLLCALDDEAAEVVPSVLALPVLRHTVGAGNHVVAGQAALRYPLTRVRCSGLLL